MSAAAALGLTMIVLRRLSASIRTEDRVAVGPPIRLILGG